MKLLLLPLFICLFFLSVSLTQAEQEEDVIYDEIDDAIEFCYNQMGEKISTIRFRATPSLIKDCAKIGDELMKAKAINSYNLKVQDNIVILRVSINSKTTIYEALLDPSLEGKLTKSQIKALEKAKKIVAEVTDSLDSDYDKALALHDYLILNSSYDIKLRKSRNEVNEMLLEGRGVCRAYAWTYQILLKLCDIESKYISGGNHAWNLVKLDGDWVHIDCTWDDVMDDYPVYAYFGLTDKRIKRSHRWKKKNYPAATSEKHHYYSKNGLSFNKLEDFVAYVGKYANGEKWIKSAHIKQLDKQKFSNRKIFEILGKAPSDVKMTYVMMKKTKGFIIIVANGTGTNAGEVKADNEP